MMLWGSAAEFSWQLKFLGLGLGACGLALLRARLWMWTVATLAACWTAGLSVIALASASTALLILNVPVIRKYAVSVWILKALIQLKVLPTISETEKEAIDAGNVWADGELFSGSPNLKKLCNEEYHQLTQEEQEFLDGPTNELCEMVSDWEVHQHRDFSEGIWKVIKEKKFFGLIIPKAYGGLGFSAIAHSAIIQKLSSRSTALGITTMVPNSLGPAELLIHYGTEDQKNHYLPRLACGDEIPCFALTEANAGSDAGAITSYGEVVKNDAGELCIKLNWKKRYITLAAIASLLGLAFKLKDPNNYLGKGTDVGITCALVPTHLDGIRLGRRHDPLGVPFYNCPTEGHNVIVPIDAIIGGADQAGKGWRMLMECLAAGRGISLPANCSGGAKLLTRVVTNYAMIRKQFGVNIGKFEGIEDPIARIVGMNYVMESARKMTCGAIDNGEKPPVVTAMCKYYFTETLRTLVNDAMDILGGAGISKGPRNIIANAYVAAPIAVTVEGANILTRTLMVFGQGAIRCHPFLLHQANAIESNDLKLFDKAFWGHVGHALTNTLRLIPMSLTRGRISRTSFSGLSGRYAKKLTWASTVFAVMTDIALGMYGGNLKRKEKLNGRFSDMLGWMYFASATIRRFETENCKQQDKALMEWSMKYCFHNIQEAIIGIMDNMGGIFKPFSLWARINRFDSQPSDQLGSKIAQMLQFPSEQRDRMTAGIYISTNENDPLARYESAFKHIVDTAYIAKKVTKAMQKGSLTKGPLMAVLQDALAQGIINIDEHERVRIAEEKRYDAIQVDNFDLDTYLKRGVQATNFTHVQATEA